MPRKDTPRYGTGYGWERGEDFWGDPTSENRVLYDALLHPYALSATLTSPPGDTREGDQYIVPDAALGAWSGQANKLAMLVEGEWRFYAPIPGVRVRIEDAGFFAWWDGEAWVPEPVSGVPNPGEGRNYDIALSVGYPPEPLETLLVLPLPQAMILGKDALDSTATILRPPRTGVQLTIARNGSPVGAIGFTPSSFNGVLSVSANVTFAPRDRLTITCPLVVPPDFKDFGAVLRMTLI